MSIHDLKFFSYFKPATIPFNPPTAGAAAASIRLLFGLLNKSSTTDIYYLKEKNKKYKIAINNSSLIKEGRKKKLTFIKSQSKTNKTLIN